MIKRKQESTEKIREATLLWKTKTPTLIHLPFYLVQYDSESGGRRKVHLPTLARGKEGITLKIRKTFQRSLQSKISNLLRPRSKVLEKTLRVFICGVVKNEQPSTPVKRQVYLKSILTSRCCKRPLASVLNTSILAGTSTCCLPALRWSYPRTAKDFCPAASANQIISTNPLSTS